MDTQLCDQPNTGPGRLTRRGGGLRSLPKLFLLALVALCLFGVGVQAQDAEASDPGAGEPADALNTDEAQPDTEAVARKGTVEKGPDNAQETADQQKSGKDEFLQGALGKPQFTISSITPAHGPLTGDTKVVVRGGPFAKYSLVYTEPKCRFGNTTMVVSAAYISCAPKARGWSEKEAKKMERTDTCVQCEGSPPSIESKPVEFTISLTGDFSDVGSSATFYYYKNPRVKAIKPIHGPKDGGTNI